jgi:hypothetical protein
MRLFAIGDIQGCAAAFDALLRKIAFRPSRDHLWRTSLLVRRARAWAATAELSSSPRLSTAGCS